MLWLCMLGSGLRVNSALPLLSPSFQSHPLLRTIKLGPSGADSLRWICLHCRTLRVSPMNSPMRLGLSPTASTLRGFFGPQFWGFISPHENCGLHALSHSPFVPPGLSTLKCGTTRSASHHLAGPSPPSAALPAVLSTRMPISAPPTSLDECFFFNSLLVGLPYSSIFCPFWLFLVFKILFSFFGCARRLNVSTYASILAESLNNEFLTASGRSIYTLSIQNYMQNDFWFWTPILPTLISNAGKALLEHVAHRPAHAASTLPGNLFDSKELCPTGTCISTIILDDLYVPWSWRTAGLD